MQFFILQLKKDKHDYLFMDFAYAEKRGFDYQDYEVMYEGTIDDEGEGPLYALDSIFTKFNIDRPEDFHGHSLSVSDIVQLDNKFYYCNPIGWKRLN